MAHYADIVSAILGPLAQGGADVYRTYSEGKQNKDELKQRKVEFAQMTDLQRAHLKAAERQQVLAQIAAVRQQQVEETYRASYMPYVAGALAIGGVGLLALVMLRRKRG